VKPAAFDYEAPESIEEAVALVADRGDEVKVLAGGQSLIPVLALRLSRFDRLVDLNRVLDLDYVRREDGCLRIGAMTREATVGDDRLVARFTPLLTAATPLIGHFQIRNRGTLGGCISHADPASEYVAAAATLDATMHVVSAAGRRDVAAADFFESSMTTALAGEEILEGVSFPIWDATDGTCGFAVEEMARREGDFAMVGAMAGVEVRHGTIARVALTVFAAGPVPVRLYRIEEELVTTAVQDIDVKTIGARAREALDPPADIHASGGYRRRVGGVMVERALRAALTRATGGDR
jgi:aerobic carbon-monoxide dehydrogenase medium subunit